MELNVSRGWVMFTGILFTVLGFYVFSQPESAIVMVAWYIAITKAIAGVLGIYAFLRTNDENKKWDLFISIIDLVAAAILILSNSFDNISIGDVIPYIIGLWLIVRGGFMAYSNFLARDSAEKWWLGALIGVGFVVGGLVLLIYPFASTVQLTHYLGFALIIIGILALLQGFFGIGKKMTE